MHIKNDILQGSIPYSSEGLCGTFKVEPPPPRSLPRGEGEVGERVLALAEPYAYSQIQYDGHKNEMFWQFCLPS